MNGIAVTWSVVNQAWVVAWNDSLLRVISEWETLRDYLTYLGVEELIP